MVNRSTFYRHYLDKFDLLEQHLNEIYEVLEEAEDDQGNVIMKDSSNYSSRCNSSPTFIAW